MSGNQGMTDRRVHFDSGMQKSDQLNPSGQFDQKQMYTRAPTKTQDLGVQIQNVDPQSAAFSTLMANQRVIETNPSIPSLIQQKHRVTPLESTQAPFDLEGIGYHPNLQRPLKSAFRVPHQSERAEVNHNYPTPPSVPPSYHRDDLYRPQAMYAMPLSHEYRNWLADSRDRHSHLNQPQVDLRDMKNNQVYYEKSRDVKNNQCYIPHAGSAELDQYVPPNWHDTPGFNPLIPGDCRKLDFQYYQYHRPTSRTVSPYSYGQYDYYP